MFHRENRRTGANGDGAIQRAWRQRNLRCCKAKIGILREGPGCDGPARIAALNPLRAHIGMCQQERIGILRKADLRQHGFSPGCDQLGDLQISGIDGKRSGRQHHQIGLFGIEFEGQQSRHPWQHRNMTQSWPARDATGWLDDNIAQASCAIFISTQIGAAQ